MHADVLPLAGENIGQHFFCKRSVRTQDRWERPRHIVLQPRLLVVTIQGAASEVMNLGLYLSGVDLAAEGELERINQFADRLEHMTEVDCDKFAGMLDANSISGTKDILRLTERLDDYVILPGCGSAHADGQ